MGFSSLPKIGVPSLPLVLLFGKMNGARGESRMERGDSWDLYRRSGKWGVGAKKVVK